ncbi:MAG TPA: DUF1549 and DUF1553 domain-containing protein [Gemmataceae bacterium]|nr:DUF1549 and DUF1553 domain-containing protein [Gemmataceae bacterium]
MAFRLLTPALLFAGAPLLAQDTDLAKIDARISEKDRQHWAFQPVKSPAIPAVKNAAWVRNPIDAFVLVKLEPKGWQPAAPADPVVLLRRMYLDLVGLPPTPEEIAESKTAADSAFRIPHSAFEQTIEKLLASPRYGERWARHWLDVVRYAETNGYERDGAKPNVWKYRDYVIRSFNEDKPFDRFILEQLAGDELPDATAETLIATGYYRLGPWDDEPADPKTDRFDQLDDIVSTTSQAFLGLTLGCARCHHHKFDPLTQHDYYRMVAIFNPLQRPVNGRADIDQPAVPHFKSGSPEGSLPRGYFLTERSPKAPDTFLLIRGQATQPGPKVQPGLPTVLVSAQPKFLPPDEYTTRRRLTLARWIANRDNPLTARVIVNRVWQQHFGEGLVRTPNDFGIQGDRPSHPELLDWLAGWFIEHGWSIKSLHRLILASNTYQQATSIADCRLPIADSSADNRQSAINNRQLQDPENRLLWRQNLRRLDVEAIRDSVLAVSGQLNRAMYGPSVLPPMPKEVLEGNSDPKTVWKASSERDACRRTIYVHTKRSLMLPLLDTLDFCDTTRSAAKRNVTTVSPQALMLFNGEFVNEQAKYFAQRLRKEAGPDAASRVDLAFRLALCRPPSAAERERMLSFLRSDGALDEMCRVILNLNEFVYRE